MKSDCSLFDFVSKKESAYFCKMESNFKEKDLQTLIGQLLRWGIVISMSIVILGLILFFLQNQNFQTKFGEFQEEKLFNFQNWYQGLKTFESTSIIMLGVMCLVLTPVLRVVFAILGFALEKDHLYVLISSVVLLIIIASIFLGAHE